MARSLAPWLLYLAIGVGVLRILVLVVSFIAGFASGAAGAAGSMDGAAAALGLGGIASILLGIGNLLLSLALLVIATILIFQTSGRGRIGAIVVAAAVVLAVVVYWIMNLIFSVIAAGMGDPSGAGAVNLIWAILEIGRMLLFIIAMLVGAWMTRAWVRQNS
jgi:hypothetical protein